MCETFRSEILKDKREHVRFVAEYNARVKHMTRLCDESKKRREESAREEAEREVREDKKLLNRIKKYVFKMFKGAQK